MGVSLVPLVVQGAAQCGNLTIHHRRGGHYVGPGCSVRDGRTRQEIQARVVVHPAVPHQAAVAVVRVLAQADVGDHCQVRRSALDGPYGLLDHPIGPIGAGANFVLDGWNAKEEHAGDAQRCDPARLGRDLRHRDLVAARHGPDGPTLPALGHEDGVDEIPAREARLPGQVSQTLGPAQTTVAEEGLRRCAHDHAPPPTRA